MKIITLIADRWKMDGGVSFGVVPQTIWKRFFQPDENNLIDICTRCLLVMKDDRRILIDTGLGNKRDEKYYRLRHRFDDGGIAQALSEKGISADSITDVLFTHLHDDHCGGTLVRNKDEVYNIFPNAHFYCSEDQFEWAMHPNARESAAYFKENFLPLYNEGILTLIKEEGEWLVDISLRKMNGHTGGQLVPIIKYGRKTIVFAADFIPSMAHIPVPYLAAVDIQPLISLREKETFLEEAFQNNYILVFQHDYVTEAAYIIKNEKGGYIGGATLRIEDIGRS